MTYYVYIYNKKHGVKLRHERLPFTRRKVTFYDMKGGLLQGVRTLLAKRKDGCGTTH